VEFPPPPPPPGQAPGWPSVSLRTVDAAITTAVKAASRAAAVGYGPATSATLVVSVAAVATGAATTATMMCCWLATIPCQAATSTADTGVKAAAITAGSAIPFERAVLDREGVASAAAAAIDVDGPPGAHATTAPARAVATFDFEAPDVNIPDRQMARAGDRSAGGVHGGGTHGKGAEVQAIRDMLQASSVRLDGDGRKDDWSRRRAEWTVGVRHDAAHLEDRVGRQLDRVIAAARRAFRGDEMVRVGRIDCHVVVEVGRVDGLLQRTAVGAADLLRRRRHVDRVGRYAAARKDDGRDGQRQRQASPASLMDIRETRAIVPHRPLLSCAAQPAPARKLRAGSRDDIGRLLPSDGPKEKALDFAGSVGGCDRHAP